MQEVYNLDIYTRVRVQIANFPPFISLFTDIDDCHPNPCKNGANCTDRVNNYTCTCMAGYKGPNCSIGKIDPFPFYYTYQ